MADATRSMTAADLRRLALAVHEADEVRHAQPLGERGAANAEWMRAIKAFDDACVAGKPDDVPGGIGVAVDAVASAHVAKAGRAWLNAPASRRKAIEAGAYAVASFFRNQIIAWARAEGPTNG